MQQAQNGHRTSLLALFVGTSLLFYLPLYGSGFVTDFLGWLNCYDSQSFTGAHRCFGVKGLYYVPFTILYVMTWLFGTHALPWYFLFAGLQGVNAFMIFKVSHRLGEYFNRPIPMGASVLGAVLFLVFPYNVEVVAWKACSNYLSALFLMLVALDSYLRYLQGAQKALYVLSISVFAISLFNIEFALLFPILLVMLHICSGNFTWNRLKPTAPYFIVAGLAILINQLLLDQSVGHYELSGPSLHPAFLAAAELKYAIKNLFLFRFVSFEWQQTVYAALSKPYVGWLSLGAIVSLVVFVLVRLKQLTPTQRISFFLLGAYVLLILPVSPLYFYFIQLSENDRYSYMAMAFLAPLISLWLWDKGTPGKIILLCYLLLNATLATRMNLHWNNSTALHNHLVETFPQTNGPTYILNVPDNYRGIFMFRNIGAESSFIEALDRFSDTEHGRIVDVLQYNTVYSTDGVNVSRMSGDTIRVEFNQWGNWWWRNGVGASNYSTEEYRVRPMGKHYQFIDRAMPETFDLLYYDGGQWQFFKD